MNLKLHRGKACLRTVYRRGKLARSVLQEATTRHSISVSNAIWLYADSVNEEYARTVHMIVSKKNLTSIEHLLLILYGCKKLLNFTKKMCVLRVFIYLKVYKICMIKFMCS